MRRLLTATALSAIALTVSAQHANRATATPDFLQTDPDGGFARSGSQYCAPTAVSNSLMWFAARGYEDLRPEGNGKRAQIALIRALAGGDYMKTSPSRGTDVVQLMRGVEQYVSDAGYTVSDIAYYGWRPADRETFRGEFPSMEAIRDAMRDPQSTAWLNVGWYVWDEDEDEYRRIGGHWVTVVGVAGDDLLIHDPSPSAGSGFRTQRITLEELSSGTLTGDQTNLPRDARGHFEIGGQMAIPQGKSCILDGVVILTLE